MLSNLINKRSSLLFLLFGVVVFTVTQFLQFDGLYGQDAYEYLRYSNSLHDFVFKGESPGAFNWPVGYPVLVMLLNLVINNTIISAQLISIFSLVGCCIVGLKLIQLIYPKTKKELNFLYVLIFMGFSPYLFRLGISSMSDVLCAFFILSAYYFFYKYVYVRQYKYLIFVIVVGTLSVMVRNAAAILVFLPMAIAGFYLMKEKKYMRLVVAILISGVIFLPAFLGEYSQVLGDGVSVFDFSFANFFSVSGTGLDGSFNHQIPNIIYGFYGLYHPAFVFLGAFFLLVLIIRRPAIPKVILTSVVLYSLFIATIYFQNKRFFVIQLPLIIVLLFPAYSCLVGVIRNRKVVGVLLFFCLGINVFLSAYTSKKIYDFQKTDLRISNIMESHQNNTLYTFWIDVAIKGRGLKFNCVNFYYGMIDQFETRSLVLFNEDKFKYQWKNKPVMDNWNKLKQDYLLLEVENLGEGWMLYEIR